MSKTHTHPFVITLADASATLELVGGKGASLARLAAAGLPVPPGFHITTDAYHRFVEERGLQEKIRALASAVNADQHEQFATASAEIALLFEQNALPAEIADAIRQAYCELGEDNLAVAVRSSATADPQRRSDVFDANDYHSPIDERVTGFPGAIGIVEGRARVIASIDDGAQLQPGEILVTTVTNIGWTPLFPRAAAVVTDVGAPLSHAAIVARELGIPAVVGCGNATTRLHTGDLLRVNGAQGTVEVLETTGRTAPAQQATV